MKSTRFIVLCLAGWFIFIATAHFFNQRPLWNDEQCVFSSIKEFSPPDFFSKPLNHMQAFPRVFLFLVQQFSRPFDFHLLALRFLPFICMVSAFWVWFLIAAKELKREYSLGVFVLCWTASIPLVYYAAELKQYSMDVLISGICLWQLKRGINRWWFALPFCSFLSYPSIFWMPLFGWNLLRYGRLTKQWRPLTIYSLTGMTCLVLIYLFDIRVSNHGQLAPFWKDHFLSLSSTGEFFDNFGQSINNLISRWFAERPRWIRGVSRFFVGGGFIYMLCVFWKTFKEDNFYFRRTGSAALAIFLLHLLGGMAHAYPFTTPRTSLFYAPVLLLMTAMAFQWLCDRHRKVGFAIQSVFVVYLAVISVGIARVVLSGDLGAQSILWRFTPLP